MIHPSDIDLIPKSREGFLRSEIATIAPGEKQDHIPIEDLKQPLEDNLSQLSIPKSFGVRDRRRRRPRMDEQEEEEAEGEDLDTRAMIMGMNKRKKKKA